MNHNLPPNAEQKYREIDGRIRLGPEGVEALDELTKRVITDINWGLLDSADYLKFMGEEDLAEKLWQYKLQLEFDEITTFPVPQTFSESEMDIFYIEPCVADEALDESFSIDYFDKKSGKMICSGFGPEYEIGDPNAGGSNFKYCFAFVADYRQPEQQTIRILLSEDDSMISELEEILKPQLKEEDSEDVPL